MKKIFKYIIPSVVAMVSLSNCADDNSLPTYVDLFSTVKMENAQVVTYNMVSADILVSNPENILEQGLELATKEDFSEKTIVTTDSISDTYSLDCKVQPGTTYYVRAYAFLKNNKVIRSESVMLTTPEYVYPINGTYTASKFYVMDWDDYNFYDQTGSDDYPAYDFTINLVEGEEDQVVITGLYGLEGSVLGAYDAEEGTVLVPSGQQITEELEGYGPAAIYGFTDDLDAEDYIMFSFDKKTGELTSGIWGVRVSAGWWDILYIAAKQK